jgi:cell division septation protein DedD
MEKQKIFWVILSVTVFVVVVLVVGVFLLKKEPTGLASTPTSTPTTPGSGIYEFGRDAGTADDDTQVLRFVIGGDGTAEGAVAGTTGGEPPATDSGGSEVTPPAVADAASAAPAATPSAVKPAAAAPAATKPAAAPAAKPAATASGPQYWIQTGSYRSQTRAEELSQMLAAKGLAGRVFSFAQADATYFRVRIGPYANKQEAEKFLAIVRKIQGLEASYISQVSAARSAN